jgi:hypothetical protein
LYSATLPNQPISQRFSFALFCAAERKADVLVCACESAADPCLRIAPNGRKMLFDKKLRIAMARPAHKIQNRGGTLPYFTFALCSSR